MKSIPQPVQMDVQGKPAFAPKTVGQKLVEELELAGVRMAFGIPGGALVSFFVALQNSKLIRTFISQHECGAAHLAIGYALFNRRKEMAVCFGTSGPGISNLITGVCSAYEEKVPLIAITGNISTQAIGKGSAQDSFETGTNITRMLDSITVRNLIVRDSRSALRLVREAIFQAQFHSRPIHINLPLDIAYQAFQEADLKQTHQPQDNDQCLPSIGLEQ